MTHEACESKLRSVVRSSMHPYQGNRVAIGRSVVYYAWATGHPVQDFNVGTVTMYITLHMITMMQFKGEFAVPFLPWSYM